MSAVRFRQFGCTPTGQALNSSSGAPAIVRTTSFSITHWRHSKVDTTLRVFDARPDDEISPIAFAPNLWISKK
jgi:hypothetical protein